MAFILLPGITNIPLWAKSKTTIRDLLSRAAELQREGPDLNRLLADPDYRPLLDQAVFQSGLLDNHILSLFDPARLVVVIISLAGEAYRFQMPAAATVRDVKQQIKRRSTAEMRTEGQFELHLTGTLERPDGKTTLLMLTRLPHQNVCFDLVPKQLKQVQLSRRLSLNESVFCRHLQLDPFQIGVDRGCWRLVRINWPEAVLAISAPDQVAEQFVRFHLDDYPANPPAIEPWDDAKRGAIPPENWPIWFRSFISASYPALVTVVPASYSPALLQLSLSIATQKRQALCTSWNVSGDLTQCLLPIVDYLAQSILTTGADIQPRITCRPVPQERSTGKAIDNDWSISEADLCEISELNKQHRAAS